MSGRYVQDTVRELMGVRGMNASQLARASGLKESTVYTFLRADRRERNVHHDTVTKLARGLGVSTCLLLESDGDVVELLTAWSTLDGEARATLLALAASLGALPD